MFHAASHAFFFKPFDVVGCAAFVSEDYEVPVVDCVLKVDAPLQVVDSTDALGTPLGDVPCNKATPLPSQPVLHVANPPLSQAVMRSSRWSIFLMNVFLFAN